MIGAPYSRVQELLDMTQALAFFSLKTSRLITNDREMRLKKIDNGLFQSFNPVDILLPKQNVVENANRTMQPKNSFF